MRRLDPYAEPRNVPGERLESQIPIAGTKAEKPSPIKLLHLLREGTVSAVAAEMHAYTSAGGNINDRMQDDCMCPGVNELDTFLHVAFRHRKADVARHLMMMGADASIQNWRLETPRMIAEKMGQFHVVEAMGQATTENKWSSAEEFKPLKTVVPQRSVLEAHLAWKGGAPKTTATTKASFQIRTDGSISTRQPVPQALPHQRGIGASAAVPGRPSTVRPHHASMSSPAAHMSSTKDHTMHYSSPIGYRQPGAIGSNPEVSAAGARHAGSRYTSSAPVYYNCGTAT